MRNIAGRPVNAAAQYGLRASHVSQVFQHSRWSPRNAEPGWVTSSESVVRSHEAEPREKRSLPRAAATPQAPWQAPVLATSRGSPAPCKGFYFRFTDGNTESQIGGGLRTVRGAEIVGPGFELGPAMTLKPWIFPLSYIKYLVNSVLRALSDIIKSLGLFWQWVSRLDRAA